MNHSYYLYRRIFILIVIVLLFPLTSFGGSSTPRLGKIGFNVQSVTLNGPSKISKGETESYTVNYRGIRVKELGVDPAVTDIATYVSLEDKDGYFRGKDDLLSYAKVIIPRGASGTVFGGITTLQLKCTSNKRIRGVGPVPSGNGKSGEKNAEVYAVVNGIISTVKDVGCK